MARLTGQANILVTADFGASIAYWRDKLGFAPYAFFGEPHSFGMLRRDDCRVMIGQRTSDQPIIPIWQIRAGLWNAYFWVSDVDALFAELSGRGAVIDDGLCDQPYGVREFGVRDPDGHDIGFGQIIDGGGLTS
jgi:catechol 2,3-dioxygenase-like lactoylglutathione lyase family enzyme